MGLGELRQLKSESIHVLREVAAESERPVMLRLAQKAFGLAPMPIRLLHVGTDFKFEEIIALRDATAQAGVAKS